jgi:hypothetical protein
MKKDGASWAVLSIDRSGPRPLIALFCRDSLDGVYEKAKTMGTPPTEGPYEARWGYRSALPVEGNPEAFVLVMTLGSGAWFRLTELERFKLGGG